MNKKLIAIIASLVVIVIGIVMTCALGVNLSLEYEGYTRLDVYMTEEANLDEVKEIVEDVFDGNYKIQFSDDFNDTVMIKLQNATDEQITEIEEKLTEKYEFDNEDADYIIEVNIPSVRVFDLVKPYIAPVIISLVLVLLYFGISFRKLKFYKSVIEPLAIIVLINALYASVLAIFRIPMSEYIIPIGILIYTMSLLGVTLYLNNQNKLVVAKKN